MNYAFETIAASATDPGATFSAFAGVGNDSLRVRDADGADLVGIQTFRNAAGLSKVTSPLLHDASVGITTHARIGTDGSQWRFPQKLTPQDTLVVEGTGSVAPAGKVDVTLLYIMYRELAGISGQFVDLAALRARGLERHSMRVDITAPATEVWGGDVDVNVTDDQLKANQLYAVTGITVIGGLDLPAVGIRSPDWGNLRIAVPGFGKTSDQDMGADFLLDMSEKVNMPLVPVFNASQKESVIVDCLPSTDDTSTSFTAVLNLVRLASPSSTSSSRKRR